MKKIILIIGVIFITLLCGCLDDDTNLDYKNVLLPDSVIVTDVVNGRTVYLGEGAVTFTVLSGNELQLDVEVKYRGDDALTYEWRFNDKVISKEQNLRYVCTQEGYCTLLVYRKNAGNATVYQFKVNIRKPFDSGILVIGKKDGRTQFDFIERFREMRDVTIGGRPFTQYVTEYVEHADIYPLYNNGEELADDPVELTYTSGSIENKPDADAQKSKYAAVQILNKNWRNSVSVNTATMEKIVAMSDEFVGDPGNLKLKSMIDVGATSLILDESGKIYTRVNYDDANPSTGSFVAEPLVFDDPHDVLPPAEIKADYITADFHNGNSPCDLGFIYEKDKKRILAITAASSNKYQNIEYSCIHTLKPTSTVAGCVDLNNFDKELVGIYVAKGLMSFMMPSYGNVYVLYKDGMDYYLHAAKIDPITYTPQHTITYKQISPDIKLNAAVAMILDQAKGLVRLATDKDRRMDTFYIGAGNTLYSMNTSGMQFTPVHRFENEGNMVNFELTGTWEKKGSMAYITEGQVFAASFDNGIFRVVNLYQHPVTGEYTHRYWVDKKYDGGVVDFLYYDNTK